MFPINIEPAVIAAIDQSRVITTVDWNTSKGSTILGFGVNAFQGFRPESFNNANYKRNMAIMKPGLIRFHNSSALQDSKTPDGLINTARRTWDANKIKAALAASVSTFKQHQPQRMISIPTWADWMDADRDGFLDRNQYDNYAQLCAEFVKIVNQDSQYKVKYWEVTNEKDDQYFTRFHTNGGWGGLKDPAQPDRLNDLITIYNKAAIAMKKVDPTIKVGGPGLARSDLQPFYVPFIKGTVAHLDFFTYHFYATGSASTTDREIYSSATDAIDSRTKAMVQVLKQASPNRTIPVMLGEYNISWTWETRDPRMTNHKGAVFDALSIAKALNSQATSTLAWNEKDGTYGKMGDNYDLRPGGVLLQFFNRFLMGDLVASSTSDVNAVTTLAVSNRTSDYKSFLIINHSGTAQRIQMNFRAWKPSQQSIERYEMTSAGYRRQTTRWNAIKDDMSLPIDSVTLLIFNSN